MLGFFFLPITFGPTWVAEPLILIDSRGWNAQAEDGLSTLRAELEKCGLVVKTTADLEKTPSPSLNDALLSRALVIISDRRDSFSPDEADAIDRFIWIGGSLLLSTDSDISPNFIAAANSFLSRYEVSVSPQGDTGASTFLAQHPVNTNISSVVNDDGPINICCRSGTPLVKVGESVAALLADQGYGKIAVVDADIIYDGAGCNISLGDNKAFATNLVLWLAGKGIGGAAGQTAQTPPEQATGTQVQPMPCPLCGAALQLAEGEARLVAAPVQPTEVGVYRFLSPTVAPLKEAGYWAVFGLEIKMLPGAAVDAQLWQDNAAKILRDSAGCFSEANLADLSEETKVQAIKENMKAKIDQILGGGRVEEIRLKPLFAAFAPQPEAGRAHQ